MESEKEGICYVQYTEGRLTGLVVSWRRKCFLKHVTEGKIDRRIEGMAI